MMMMVMIVASVSGYTQEMMFENKKKNRIALKRNSVGQGKDALLFKNEHIVVSSIMNISRTDLEVFQHHNFNLGLEISVTIYSNNKSGFDFIYSSLFESSYIDYSELAINSTCADCENLDILTVFLEEPIDLSSSPLANYTPHQINKLSAEIIVRIVGYNNENSKFYLPDGCFSSCDANVIWPESCYNDLMIDEYHYGLTYVPEGHDSGTQLRDGSSAESSLKKDYKYFKDKTSTIRPFPNPISSGQLFTVSVPIMNKVTSLSGQEHVLEKKSNNTYILPTLQPGIYLIHSRYDSSTNRILIK